MRLWSDASSLRADTSPYAELGQELERSRRYERAFSLVRVTVDHAVGNGSSNGAASELTDRLREDMRSVDRVWTLDGDLVYLLPECDRERAAGFVRRLETTIGDGAALSATVASFPEDGLTGGSLIELVLGNELALAQPDPAPANGHNGSARSRWAGVGRFRFPRSRRSAPMNGGPGWTEISATPDAAAESQDGASATAVDDARSSR